MKKKIIIIVIAALLCLALGVACGFVFGKQSAKNNAQTVAEVDEPNAVLSDFQNNDAVVDSYASEGFGAEYLEKNFGMNSGVAKKFEEHPEEWLAYNMYIEVKNNDVDQLSCYGFSSTEASKKNVYVFSGDSGVTTIPAKGSCKICVPVLIKDNNLSDEQAQKLVSSLKISLCYGAYFEQDQCVNYYTDISFKG